MTPTLEDVLDPSIQCYVNQPLIHPRQVITYPIPGLQVEAVLPPVFDVPGYSFYLRRLHHVLPTLVNFKQLV
jgi:hypothetical protein